MCVFLFTLKSNLKTIFTIKRCSNILEYLFSLWIFIFLYFQSVPLPPFCKECVLLIWKVCHISLYLFTMTNKIILHVLIYKTNSSFLWTSAILFLLPSNPKFNNTFVCWNLSKKQFNKYLFLFIEIKICFFFFSILLKTKLLNGHKVL